MKLFSTLLVLISCAALTIGQRTGDVRLTGFESTRLMGRLELYAFGNWFGVCNDNFGWAELAVACRQLGLGNGVRVYNSDTDAGTKAGVGSEGRTDSAIVRFGGASIIGEGRCTGNENAVLNCGFTTSHDCLSTEAVGIQCSEYRPQPYSGQVRLVGGAYSSEGIVEVYFNGQWGVVCDSGFNQNTATAVCRQLGHGNASFTIGDSSYGSPSSTAWVISASCGGSERCLSSCLSSAPSTSGSCPANGFATVKCRYDSAVVNIPGECERFSSPGEGSLRLYNGTHVVAQRGTLQVYRSGQWGEFCGQVQNYNRQSLDVICRQLGYRTWTTAGAVTSTTRMHFANISCTGVENAVSDCQTSTSTSQCSDSNRHLHVTCHPDKFTASMYGTVTLSARTDGAGLLLVAGHGGYSPVCDQDFDTVDGRVACRQLGYDDVYAVRRGSYYGGTGNTVSITHIDCEGSESHLLSCDHRNDTHQRCDSSSLAGLHCNPNASDTNRGNLRLSGGNSSSGALEIQLDGEWQAVCFLLFSNNSADVACRQLGFSDGAVSFSSDGQRLQQDTFTSTHCRGSEQRLYDCLYITLGSGVCSGAVRLSCDTGVVSCNPACVNGRCSQSGVCECFQGWSGVDCSAPVCDPPCKNGACSEDMRCVCSEGWTGEDCGTPVCNPPCKNGNCSEDMRCVCSEGWTGEDCSTPVCNPPCKKGNCSEDMRCVCSEGWTGEDCSTPVCDPSCKNGNCSEDMRCVCSEGWTGEDCGTPVCNPPCKNGACSEDMRCVCSEGWTGEDCSTPVCDPPCKNGACSKDMRCVCSEGWTGEDCSVPVCDPSCKYGNCSEDMRCVCSEGWTGEDCGTPVCDPPCKNGNCSEDMRCVCSEGWTGEDCNTPVCSPPCKNGNCSEDMRCVCSEGWTGEDCSTSAAQLPVPTSITFTLVQSKSVTLTVQVSGANGKTISTVFTSNDGHTVQLSGTVSSNFAILQVNGLRPGTTYTVRAFVVEGSTQGQAKVSTVTTKADVPSGPVRGLTTSSISSRSVVLTWNAPEDKYINSRNGLTGYYVELRRFEGNRCEGLVQSANTAPNRRYVTFSNLQPATRYCVIVFPENEGGRARELHASGGKTTFTTHQDAPSDSPTLRLVQPQFTQLTLAWDEPSQPNGQLTQYVIQYRQGSGRWTESTVSASAKYKLFTSGFDSGSRYQVRIAAVNAFGRGPFSTPVLFTMRPPVYNIGVCRLNSTSAKFVWKLRSQPSMGGELTQVRFTLSSSGQRKEYTVNKTSSGIERGGLMNKEYRLSVVLVWSEGDRLYFQPDSKDLGTLQTDPNCFPTKPRNLVAKSVNLTDFTVIWSEPSTTNGPVLKYITTVNNRTFEGMSTSLRVSGLKEAVQYTVKVRAVNKFGEGPNAVLSVRTRDSVCSPPCVNGVCSRRSQEMVCECDDEWIGEDCSTPGVSITLDRSRLTVLENKTSVEFCLLKSRQTSVNITAMVIPSEVLDELSSGSGKLDGDFDSAEEGRDFEPAPQEITIPSDVIRRCFQLNITDDTILEREEIFHFNVMFMNERSLQSMGIKAMDLNGSVIIDNDDEVTVQFESTSYEELESEGIVIVNITASGQASFPYSLSLTTMDVEAKQPSDYNLSSTVTFEASEESVLISITINNDDVFEPNETFKVIMTLPDDVTIPGIRVGKNNVTLVRILNDDPVVVSSSLNPSTAVVSSSLDLTTSVVTTAVDTSTDIAFSSSSLSTLVISTPNPTPQPTPPTVLVSFEKPQYTAYEGGDVQISLVSNLTANFNYTVEISLNDINTTSGSDYSTVSNKLNVTFLAGVNKTVLVFATVDDYVLEEIESFECTISSIFSPSQDVQFIRSIRKTVVIIYDDEFFVVTLGRYDYYDYYSIGRTYPVAENDSIVSIPIFASGVASFEYAVKPYIREGTAKVGSDFTLPERIIFQLNQTKATLNVTILDDNVLEPLMENVTLSLMLVGGDYNIDTSTGSVVVEIFDDDACPENLVFPRTAIGETRSLPCSSIAGGSGMIGEMRSTCTSEGVWGSVDMSQCTFRKDVPTLPILWRVELYWINLTQLEQALANITTNRSTERAEQLTGEIYRIAKISKSVGNEPHTYLVQFSDNAIYARARESLFWNIQSEVTVIRYAGCDCCVSGQVDLNNQDDGVRLCDGDAVSARVPCSCNNDINECALRFVKSGNVCHLDTDQDGIADREDPCVGCCVSELNIFEWPKTDHGSSSEASCSQLHPSFGDSKVRRTCRVNDIWDPVDIGSCTFKNTTTRSTPILLFNATVNSSNTDTVRKTLNEQAESLLPNNGSSFNVTEVAFVASSISGQRVVFFVIEFSENTTLEENFITTIKNDTVNLIEAVIPSDNCSCSSNRSNDLRRLCIGTATAPCDCERRGTCKCVDPYIREAGGTCSLDTDGDGEPDYKDICPLEHGTDCGTAPPPAAQNDCPREKDAQWNLLWKQTQRGQTRVQRCPNGITRSAGLASRECMENGQWGEVDATKCVSRAFQAISENNEDVNRVLDSAVNNDLPLTTEERETVVEVAEELSTALDNTAAENTSVLPGDLTITTQVINGLADLSENNGLFNIENPREQQEVVANVLNRVLDSDNAPAFTATRQNAPAVSILESTEQLARSGFTNQNISFVPPVTDNQTVNQEEIVQENFAIQSNRFNPKSFMQPTFQVSFPKVSLSAFANRNLVPQIVIPGDFLSALLPESPLSETETPISNPSLNPETTTGPSSLSENPVDVVSFTMNNLQEHLPLQLADKGDAERIDRFEAGSLIVSSQVTGVDSTAVNTGPTVNLSFSLLQGDDKNVEAGPNEQIEIKCAAWNFTGGPNGTGGWSFDGIEVVSVNDTHVECTSKHLTSFIVLVSVVPLEGPPHPVFNVFTYIGCSISLVCLLISIIFFISLRKELIKRLHNFVHLNLCIALACGLIVFIGGMEHATSIQVACVIVSVLQHYFFLAAFSWMLCEAVMIYVLLVRVFRANDRKWIYLYLSLGWGLPVPIVIVSVAIRHYEYFIADPVSNVIFACWLPVKDGVIAAFIAPMLAILLVNAVLLTISMASLAKSKCGQKQEMKEEKKQGAQTAWQLTKAVLILMPLMGFTWVIGLLAVGPGRDVVAFVFIVLNSLQGLFIFILHVVRHEKVWGKIKARLPTIREGKLTFWTSHSSSATKSTLYSKSRKQSTLSSKHYASTMSSHDPGLMYSETKGKPLDEASIKDGEIEGLVLEVKNGENSGDEPNPGVSATTFGITEPTNGAQETSISTPPPESTTTPDNEQPITLATSFGFVPLTEQGDPLPPDTPQTEPESTFL